VKHTRPFIGPNYEHLKQLGITPGEEMLNLLKNHSLKHPVLRNVGIVDLLGEERELPELLDQSEKWLTVPWAKII